MINLKELNALESLQITAAKQTAKNLNKPLYILLDTVNNQHFLSDFPVVKQYKTILIYTYFNGKKV